MSAAKRPGVLECGCLWDGRVLSIGSCSLAADDHGLGRVVFVRGGLSEWHTEIITDTFTRSTDESWFTTDNAAPRQWLWDR